MVLKRPRLHVVFKIGETRPPGKLLGAGCPRLAGRRRQGRAPLPAAVGSHRRRGCPPSEHRSPPFADAFSLGCPTNNVGVAAVPWWERASSIVATCSAGGERSGIGDAVAAHTTSNSLGMSASLPSQRDWLSRAALGAPIAWHGRRAAVGARLALITSPQIICRWLGMSPTQPPYQQQSLVDVACGAHIGCEVHALPSVPSEASWFRKFSRELAVTQSKRPLAR